MTLVAKLERVLDEERRLLLYGDYQQLEKLAETKLRLSELFADSPLELSQDHAAKLAQSARRNEVLLGAAQRGIQAAMMHLREAADDSFQSYSKEGQRAPLAKSSKLRQRI